MYERMLVPLDGSELAEQALPYTEELAKNLKSEVILITICLPDDPLERALTEYIERRAQSFNSLGIRTRSLCIEGEPATSIIDFAEKNDIGLIVISTHGRSGIGRWPLGSIANKVVQKSHVPLFLVRSGQLPTANKKFHKILVTLDGSRFAEAIIPYIENLAKAMSSEVILTRVVESLKLPKLAAYREREQYEQEYTTRLEREAKRYLSKTKGLLAAKGISARSVLLSGKSAETIIQYANDVSASLIALTTHGFSGITKWAYGSVASRIIEGSSKPIFLVRAPLPSAQP